MVHLVKPFFHLGEIKAHLSETPSSKCLQHRQIRQGNDSCATVSSNCFDLSILIRPKPHFYGFHIQTLSRNACHAYQLRHKEPTNATSEELIHWLYTVWPTSQVLHIKLHVLSQTNQCSYPPTHQFRTNVLELQGCHANNLVQWGKKCAARIQNNGVL